MTKKKIETLLIIGAIILIILGSFFYYSRIGQKLLEVDFLDVGQGDSILIKSPYGQNILIDGGPDKKVIGELGKNLAWWDRKIDLMILTHPHDDHVTGFNEVIKRYKVGKIIYTGAIHNGPNFIAWLKLVKDKKIPISLIEHPQTIKLGEKADMDILYPFESLAGKEFENLNNTSIVIKLKYGENKFLLAGDIEKEIESKLVSKKIDLSADVFKADHHGSDTSNTEEFLKKINSKIAVIQVGKNNKFGHPSLRVLKRIERLGVKVFRNDLDGTVGFFSDGAKIWEN